MITLKVEQFTQLDKIAIVEREDGVVMRRFVIPVEVAKDLFFDGVKLCVELERRERTSS